jgi:hypothetical protein
MQDEFEVDVEDGSAEPIAKALVKLWEESNFWVSSRNPRDVLNLKWMRMGLRWSKREVEDISVLCTRRY